MSPSRPSSDNSAASRMREALAQIHTPEPNAAKAKDFRRAGKAIGVVFAKRFITDASAIKSNGRLTTEASNMLGNAALKEISVTAAAFRTYGYREDQVAILEASMVAGFKTVRPPKGPE